MGASSETGLAGGGSRVSLKGSQRPTGRFQCRHAGGPPGGAPCPRGASGPVSSGSADQTTWFTGPVLFSLSAELTTDAEAHFGMEGDALTDRALAVLDGPAEPVEPDDEDVVVPDEQAVPRTADAGQAVGQDAMRRATVGRRGVPDGQRLRPVRERAARSDRPGRVSAQPCPFGALLWPGGTDRPHSRPSRAPLPTQRSTRAPRAQPSVCWRASRHEVASCS